MYRALDAKLKRDVALKVLLAAYALEPDRVARFTREAQILASLNHPNIAAIYGLEDSGAIQALALELVEGPTLADRLSQGPMPLEEALKIARQIAEALEAAHEHGVVHRDLKPANMKVQSDGTVKVLDFGLAKLAEPEGAVGEPEIADSTAPTVSPAMATGAGVLIGTIAYMSPEQAKGKPSDKRGDIWAFGCVLYEMLTGVRAFRGEGAAETLVRVQTGEIDWAALPSYTPAAIHRLLRRALAKDVRQRLADAHSAQLDIQEALASPSVPESPAIRRGFRSGRALVGVAVVAIAAAAGTAAVWVLKPSAPLTVSRFSMMLPESDVVLGTLNTTAVGGSSLALSPDGSTLVYTAYRDGTLQLFRRDVEHGVGPDFRHRERYRSCVFTGRPFHRLP